MAKTGMIAGRSRSGFFMEPPPFSTNLLGMTLSWPKEDRKSNGFSRVSLPFHIWRIVLETIRRRPRSQSGFSRRSQALLLGGEVLATLAGDAFLIRGPSWLQEGKGR